MTEFVNKKQKIKYGNKKILKNDKFINKKQKIKVPT